MKQPEISKSLPGASATRFSADLGGPWGTQGPPWGFRVVFWGALGPPRGPFSETGGAQKGAQGRPFDLGEVVLVILGDPKVGGFHWKYV